MRVKISKILKFNNFFYSAVQNMSFLAFRSKSRCRSGIPSVFLLAVAVSACKSDRIETNKTNSVQVDESVEVPEEEVGEAPQKIISLKLSLVPEKPTTNDMLRVVVESNVRTSYSWYVNGERLPSATSSRLKAKWFEKGDEVLVRVTAVHQDKKEEKSIKVVIGNLPPRWDKDCAGLRRGGNPSGYRVRASDPDSKVKVTFSLTGGPVGLTIGETSGVLKFDSDGLDVKSGKYSVSIIATDGDGATADKCEFPISVTSVKKER